MVHGVAPRILYIDTAHAGIEMRSGRSVEKLIGDIVAVDEVASGRSDIRRAHHDALRQFVLHLNIPLLCQRGVVVRFDR